jgi:hypothetical protein
VTAADLRRALETRLPDYMVPSAFVLRDALPLTPNGKIDRKSSCRHRRAGRARGAVREPRSPAEKTLALIWAQVLSVERVGIYDNFFELGGVHHQHPDHRPGEEAGLDDSAPAISEPDGRRFGEGGRNEAGARRASALEGDVPLTPIQHWFFERRWPTRTTSTSGAHRSAERLDPTALARATEQIMIHHDAPACGTVARRGVAAIHAPPGEPVPFLHVDLRAVAEPQLRARIERDAEQAQESLNLGRGRSSAWHGSIWASARAGC